MIKPFLVWTILVTSLLVVLVPASAQETATSMIATSAGTKPGRKGPVGGYEAYKSAARTYPANVIPPSMVQNAKKTFDKIATQTAPTGNNVWQSYGPLHNSIQPGVLSFSGATNATASRDTALVIAPTCVPGNCRLWVASAGGGVWRVAFAFDPTRRAILLVAGDKSGHSEKKFYQRLIAAADKRFDDHLERLRRARAPR